MELLLAGVALHETECEDPEVAGFAPKFIIRCISSIEGNLIRLQHALNRITSSHRAWYARLGLFRKCTGHRLKTCDGPNTDYTNLS